MLQSLIVGSWDTALALELAHHGYSRANLVELHCGCGVRVAVAELTNTYCCPVCHQEQAGTFLATGFTRRALPLTEQVSQMLSPLARRWLKREQAREQVAQAANAEPLSRVPQEIGHNRRNDVTKRKIKLERRQCGLPLVAVGCA